MLPVFLTWIWQDLKDGKYKQTKATQTVIVREERSAQPWCCG